MDADPILAVYCPDQHRAERIRLFLPARAHVLCAAAWVGFENAVAQADCGVVLIEWLGSGAASRDLALVRSRLPLQPIVLVTRRDADNARGISELRMDEVVWIEEADRTLAAAIERALCRRFLWRVGHALESSTTLSPLLRQALGHACLSRTPPRSVAVLADAVRHDRRTLWRHWHATNPPTGSLRLEDFLHWLVLLQAMVWKEAGHSWADAAGRLCIHEHTLARIAHRLTGFTLRKLAAGGLATAQERFHQAITPLLGPARDILG